jgi:flagellar protein FlbD
LDVAQLRKLSCFFFDIETTSAVTQMIKVTRLNHVPLYLNSDLIEHIDMTPDTVISLTTGQKFMVLEPADDVVDKIISFRRCCANALPTPSEPPAVLGT